MRAVLDVILLILDLYWWIVIAMIIMSWLISFNVINTRNQFVEGLWRVLNQLTEPVLRPIRRIMPNISGLDLSPIILFIIIFFIKAIIGYYIYPAVAGAGL
jgi:YggT family protein